MTGIQLPKPKAGQPVAFSARVQRQMAEAIEAASRRSIGRRSPFTTVRDHGLVMVRNDTADEIEAHKVVRLGEAMWDPAEDASQFHLMPAFAGLAPEEDTPFAVTAHAIPAGTFGRAVASGVVPVEVTSDDGDPGKRFAALDDSTPAVLIAVAEPTGCEILWRAEGTGAQWALVRLSTHGKRIMTVLQLIPWGFPTAGYADVTLTLPNPNSGFSPATDTLTLPWDCDLETWRDALLAHPAIDGNASRIDAEDGAWPASALSVKFVGPFLNRTIALPAIDVSNLTGGAFPTVQAIRLLVNV